mmetsp:Transcript_6130/g.12831  ORF Transcript_6130/g.12831 Transcript_6130/m.12831 type:complete len:400 (+) Transcript_6130:52-1251(+)
MGLGRVCGWITEAARGRRKRKLRRLLDASAAETDTSVSTCLSSTENLSADGLNSPQINGKWERKRVSKDDFELLRCVGRGSYGKVLLVQKKDSDVLYAMKILKKALVTRRNQEEHTWSERLILQYNSHPFLVGLRYAFQTTTKLYLITDFCSGGELFYHLRQRRGFTERESQFYCCEILLGLEFLHGQSFLYRDLKPENILLDADGHLRLADFGLSKMHITPNDTTETFCGTAEYLAPEIMMQMPYSFPVDWWALGALAFEMLEGRPAFYHANRKVMCDLIVRGEFHFRRRLSKAAEQLVSGLLVVNPKKRLSTAAAVKSMSFFKGVDWNKVLAKEVKPALIPNVGDPREVRNFDPTFTTEPVSHENCQSPVALGFIGAEIEKKAAWKDFSYSQSPLVQ